MGQKGRLQYFYEFAHHYATSTFVGAAFLVLFGATPENLVAALLDKLPWIGGRGAHWVAHYGFRGAMVSLGLILITKEILEAYGTWRPRISLPVGDKDTIERKMTDLQLIYAKGMQIGTSPIPDHILLSSKRAQYERWVHESELVIKRDFSRSDLFHFRHQRTPVRPGNGTLREETDSLRAATDARCGYVYNMIERCAEALQRVGSAA